MLDRGRLNVITDGGRPVARHERGQMLVIVGVGMIALIAMVGLVIDGGYAWGQQRKTQNGADSVSKAGTVVVQQYLAATGVLETDGDVGCAVEAASLANEVKLDLAEYTDYQGQLLSPSIPVGPCAVGAGAAIPPGAQGVRATTSRTFDTFLMQVVGISTLDAIADATAVVGVPTGLPGGALPVTIPIAASTCDALETPLEVRDDDLDGTWEPYELIEEADASLSNMAIVPLCDIAPGSVGWLDFECGQNLQQSVDDPCEKFINIPAWLHTQTGNVNSLEDELGQYHGSNVNVAEADDSVVAIPIHDNTCSAKPADNDPSCQPLDFEWSGNGDNLYYHIPFWVGFKLNEAYVSGGDPECQAGPGAPVLVGPLPPGKVGCLKGWFVDRYDAPGPIGLASITPGQNVAMAILLID